MEVYKDMGYKCLRLSGFMNYRVYLGWRGRHVVLYCLYCGKPLFIGRIKGDKVVADKLVSCQHYEWMNHIDEDTEEYCSNKICYQYGRNHFWSLEQRGDR